MGTYALPAAHRDVGAVFECLKSKLSGYAQMLEKSLVDTDPEVAEIMVYVPQKASERY